MLDKDDIKHFASLLKKVSVEEVMSSPACTINVQSDMSTVEETFVKEKIRHMPVVDNDRKLVGLISQRDIYRAVAPRRFIDGTVYYREGIIIDQDGYYEKDSLNKFILNHVMHKDPKAVTANKSLGDAVHIMVTEKLGCVPVIDKDQRVIGIITRFDILKFSNLIYKEVIS
jgi:acetoin utilization protein AcuB